MTGQILDDVYAIETQSPINTQGIATGIVKMAGTFTKGIPGGVYSISDYASAVRLLGPSTLTVDGPICLQVLINQKAGGIQVVPVFGSTATSAIVTLQDSQATPGNVLILTAAQVHPQTGVTTALLGSDANSMTATVANSGNGSFNLTIQYGNTVENYPNLTLANMVATINAASNIAIASLPASPSSNLPKNGSFGFTGGSNGTPGDADFIGTVGSSGNRTGLSALEPIIGNSVFIANQSSTAINTAIVAHAKNFNCIGATCAPINSTVTATTTAKGTISQDNVAFLDGWRTMLDADTNTVRNVAPTALALGMASQNAVYKSWGNKSIYGTLAAVTPRSIVDLATLQQAGIMCVTDNIPRGGVGTRSGVASDGSDIYVRAMRYFLETSIMSTMGWAVDEMQSSSTNDSLRSKVKSSIETFLSGLANPLDSSDKMIDSYLVVCDLTNNPIDQIAAGKLSVNVKVRLLGAAKQIIINADISETTITTTSQAA
jgi:hypothetical protein